MLAVGQALALAAALAAAFFVSPAAASVDEERQPRRVPVEPQSHDDDCGPAALVTLLRMAGIEISERALLSGLSSTRERREGLTALDLRQMVERSGTGAHLTGRFVAESRLVETIQRQPAIMLLYERGETRNGVTQGIGHFVVIEAWSPTRGFLVADPALGRRGFISLTEVRQQAHSRSDQDGRDVLLMHLEPRGGVLAQALPVTPDDERRFRDLSDLRRLATGLPRGRTVISVAVSHGSFRLRSPDDPPLALRASDTTASVMVQHGLDSRTTLSWSLGMSRGGTALHLGGLNGFSLEGYDVETPMQLAISRRIDIGLPASVSTELYASALFRNVIRPSGLTAGIAGQLRRGRMSFFASAGLSAARVEGQTFVDVHSSFGVSGSVGHGFDAGIAVSANAPIGGLPSHGELTLSLGRRVGRSILIEGYASHGIFQGSGARLRQLGISMTFMVPNRVR